MSRSLDIEKDPFLVLLTDALRAGPGSPEWHEAVLRLKSSNEQVDEYRLLIEAREALESGKDYRAVRAGPGFTQRLMTTLDREERPASRRTVVPLATWLAVLAGIVILIVVGTLVYELYPHGNVNPENKGIDELAGTYFPNEVLSSSFDDSIGMTWRKIGSLAVDAQDGLRAGAADVQPGSYLGGGIVAADPLPPDQPFSFQVTLHVAKPDAVLIPQVFVSNSSDFSADRAVGSRELVWQLKGDQQQAVVAGDIKAHSALPAHTTTLAVRIIVNRDLTII